MKQLKRGRLVCLAVIFFFCLAGWLGPRVNTQRISLQIMTIILVLSQGQCFQSDSPPRLFFFDIHFYFPVVPKQGFYKTGDIATQAVC